MQNVTQQVVNSVPQVCQTGQAVAAAAVPVQMPYVTYPQQNTSTYIPVNVPQQTAPQQPSSGVNIIIYNPSVNPAASTVANSNNSYVTPAALYTGVASGVAGAAGLASDTTVGGTAAQTVPSYPLNYYTKEPKKASSDDVAKTYIANSSIKEEKTVKKEPDTHKEKIVQLTDDYIKTLENYMNNPNPKVREMAIKEIMERFKEHKSRYTDIALTNLLNKALQDRSKAVRFIALATLNADYAHGDDLTVDILNNMQSSSAVYGEDALMAADILLRMSRRKVEVLMPGKEPENKKVNKR